MAGLGINGQIFFTFQPVHTEGNRWQYGVYWPLVRGVRPLVKFEIDETLSHAAGMEIGEETKEGVTVLPQNDQITVYIDSGLTTLLR